MKRRAVVTADAYFCGTNTNYYHGLNNEFLLCEITVGENLKRGQRIHLSGAGTEFYDELSFRAVLCVLDFLKHL